MNIINGYIFHHQSLERKFANFLSTTALIARNRTFVEIGFGTTQFNRDGDTLAVIRGLGLVP